MALGMHHSKKKIAKVDGFWGRRAIKFTGAVDRMSRGYAADVCVATSARKRSMYGRAVPRNKSCGTGSGATPTKALAKATTNLAAALRKRK